MSQVSECERINVVVFELDAVLGFGCVGVRNNAFAASRDKSQMLLFAVLDHFKEI